MNELTDPAKMLKALKKIKEEAGLTYPKLSELVGVGVATVTRWCINGDWKMHKSTRFQVARFISGYRKAKKERNVEEFLKGRLV